MSFRLPCLTFNALLCVFFCSLLPIFLCPLACLFTTPCLSFCPPPCLSFYKGCGSAFSIFLIADPDPGPNPGFWWPKIGKNSLLADFFILFWTKIAIYLSLGLHKERPSYRRSLQLSKENIQHFKKWKCFSFFYFCGSFYSALSVFHALLHFFLHLLACQFCIPLPVILCLLSVF